MGHFDKQLATGQLGESDIALWCKSRGNCVMPVYEKEIDTGKGPRFFTPEGQLVAPDMFIMPPMIWIEAKHKTHFTWHRKTSRWVTGVDLKHYQDYREVQRISGRPVWLLFLHRESLPWHKDQDAGCPPRCPVGLFGNDIEKLAANENHRHDNWGRSGMVYWAERTLKRLATLDEIQQLRGASPSLRAS